MGALCWFSPHTVPIFFEHAVDAAMRCPYSCPFTPTSRRLIILTVLRILTRPNHVTHRLMDPSSVTDGDGSDPRPGILEDLEFHVGKVDNAMDFEHVSRVDLASFMFSIPGKWKGRRTHAGVIRTRFPRLRFIVIHDRLASCLIAGFSIMCVLTIRWAALLPSSLC